MSKTLFERIIAREIPADIVHEDDQCLAFRDISPQAPVHLLVVPKRAIPSVAELAAEDAPLVGHMLLVLQKLAAKQGLADGYRIVINTGRDGGQSVDHLHFHLLGGRSLDWPPG